MGNRRVWWYGDTDPGKSWEKCGTMMEKSFFYLCTAVYQHHITISTHTYGCCIWAEILILILALIVCPLAHSFARVLACSLARLLTYSFVRLLYQHITISTRTYGCCFCAEILILILILLVCSVSHSFVRLLTRLLVCPLA